MPSPISGVTRKRHPERQVAIEHWQTAGSHRGNQLNRKTLRGYDAHCVICARYISDASVIGQRHHHERDRRRTSRPCARVDDCPGLHWRTRSCGRRHCHCGKADHGLPDQERHDQREEAQQGGAHSAQKGRCARPTGPQGSNRQDRTGWTCDRYRRRRPDRLVPEPADRLRCRRSRCVERGPRHPRQNEHRPDPGDPHQHQQAVAVPDGRLRHRQLHVRRRRAGSDHGAQEWLLPGLRRCSVHRQQHRKASNSAV